jgi:hypothetical protein
MRMPGLGIQECPGELALAIHPDSSKKLELIYRAHTPACHRALRVLLKICSIEHAQDSLVQACAVVSIGVSLDLKHTEASFSPSSIDSLCLRVAQVPKSRDMAIFGSTDDRRRTKRLLYPLLRMRARGVIIIINL